MPAAIDQRESNEDGVKRKMGLFEIHMERVTSSEEPPKIESLDSIIGTGNGKRRAVWTLSGPRSHSGWTASLRRRRHRRLRCCSKLFESNLNPRRSPERKFPSAALRRTARSPWCAAHVVFFHLISRALSLSLDRSRLKTFPFGFLSSV